MLLITVTIPFSSDNLEEVTGYLKRMVGIKPLAIGYTWAGKRSNVMLAESLAAGMSRYDVTISEDDLDTFAAFLNRTVGEFEVDFAGEWTER